MNARIQLILGRCPWARLKSRGAGLKRTITNSEGKEIGMPEMEVEVQRIAMEDWQAIINPGERLKAGQWVRVLRGAYSRDIAVIEYVGRAHIYLLVVPRIATDGSRKKRKASTKSYTPHLFDPTKVYGGARLTEDPNRNQDTGCYKLHGQEFVLGGLLRISADRMSISTRDLYTFGEVATEFQLSKLPESWKRRMPLPVEWRFEVKEKVLVKNEGKKAVITEVFEFDDGQKGACIEMGSNQGATALRCQQLQKIFEIGDFVECLGGVNAGRKGWVELTENEKGRVHIIEKRIDRGSHAPVERVSVSIGIAD